MPYVIIIRLARIKVLAWRILFMLQLKAGVLLAITLAGLVVVYISNSMFAKKISKTNADRYVYLITQSLICAIGVIIVSGGVGEVSLYSVICGMMFGRRTAEKTSPVPATPTFVPKSNTASRVWCCSGGV